MSDEVANFVNRDKALCSQALDGDRDVLIRAAEMMNWAHQQPVPEVVQCREETVSKEEIRSKLADVIRAHTLFNGRCEACGERATHQSLHQADVLMSTPHVVITYVPPYDQPRKQRSETCPNDDLRCSCAVGKGHRA